MELQLPKKGRMVVAVWSFLLGTVLVPIFFAILCVFVPRLAVASATITALLHCALVAIVWVRSGSFCVRVLSGTAHGTPSRLCITRGKQFCITQTVPLPAVQRVTCYQTPLLLLGGCKLVVLGIAGRSYVCPALRAQDADTLCQLILRARIRIKPTTFEPTEFASTEFASTAIDPTELPPTAQKESP